MKRLILLLLLVAITFVASAQSGTYQMVKGTTMVNVATDYTVTNTTEKWFLFKAEKDQPISVDYQVLLTKGTGSHTDMSVQLYGRKFSGDAWSAIGPAVTSGTITTTYLLTVSHPGNVQYREFKLGFTGTGTGTTTISNQQFKVWYK